MQFIFIVFLLAICVTTAWNMLGPVQLSGINQDYRVRISEGDLAGQTLNADAALLIQDWVENRTKPEYRPFQIWWHQLWYNAITSGYELKLWVDPNDSGLRYALYQTGNMIFLRIEYRGKNRVLRAEFNTQELEEALRKYVQKP